VELRMGGGYAMYPVRSPGRDQPEHCSRPNH
jgi:hypothetical protein